MTDEQRALVAHLFRRAGFGARKADFDAAAGLDYVALVESLVNPANRDSATIVTQQAGGGLFSKPTLSAAQDAWLKAMVNTRAPLVERMTLFLSNHFATAYDANSHVDVPALLDQHAKIRTYALGSFADLAHAMIDDKALGCFLNNDRNNKAKPNENLARELMELFMLGAGNYTESDVKETARALTGYSLVSTNSGSTYSYKPALHDDGLKTILGVTSSFTPHSVIDLFLSQPAAPTHIATKLVAHFVSPTPDATLVGAVAASLRSDWHLGNALRVLFTSSQFASADASQTLAKTPAEYVAGIMRALGRTEIHDGSNLVIAAGQTLFKPPSVAGWQFGAQMLGPGAMLARYNASSLFARYNMKHPASGLPTSPDVGSWTEALGLASVSPSTMTAVNGYLNATSTLQPGARAAGVVTLLGSSPDFNLA